LDGDPLGVDRSQIGVLEEGNEVGFSSLLESHNGRRLEAKIGLEILGNFTNKPLEGQLADEQLGGLLVASDFTEGNGTRPEAMGLLDTPGGLLGGLAGGALGGKLFTRSLASGGLAGGLLGAGHVLFLREVG